MEIQDTQESAIGITAVRQPDMLETLVQFQHGASLVVCEAFFGSLLLVFRLAHLGFSVMVYRFCACSRH